MTRRVIGLLTFLLLVASCDRQNGSPPENGIGYQDDVDVAGSQAVISFDKKVHDFGTIVEGEQVVCYFEYSNEGDVNLLLQNVTATCGCTTPDWNKEPLPPGKKEVLKVIFDSSGRSGMQKKRITVNSNATERTIQLEITAKVI